MLNNLILKLYGLSKITLIKKKKNDGLSLELSFPTQSQISE